MQYTAKCYVRVYETTAGKIFEIHKKRHPKMPFLSFGLSLLLGSKFNPPVFRTALRRGVVGNRFGFAITNGRQ